MSIKASGDWPSNAFAVFATVSSWNANEVAAAAAAAKSAKLRDIAVGAVVVLERVQPLPTGADVVAAAVARVAIQ